MISSVDGTILWANRTLADWLGVPGQELAGKSVHSLLTPGGRIHYESIVPSLALGLPMHNVSLDLKKEDGLTLHLLASTTLVHRPPDADGGPIPEVRWVCIDVTGRRSQERDLLVSQRRLSRLQNLSTELVSAVTDEEIGFVVLAQLVDGVKADRGAVMTLGDDGVRSVLAMHSAPPMTNPKTPDHRLDWAEETVQRSGQPAFEAVSVEGETHQLAALPLHGSDGLLGVVLLELRRERMHDEEEKSLLLAASQMCEQALDRARLLNRHRRDAQRSTALSGLLHRLEEETTLAGRSQLIADFLVPDHADYATVEIPASGREPIGLRHCQPELESVLRTLRTEVAIRSELPFSLAASRETRQPQHMQNIDPAVYEDYGLDNDQLEALRRLAPHSYIGLPLVARNTVVGSVLLAFSNSDRIYEPGDIPFYQQIADACALSLENARLYEHERDTARQLQDALMPRVSLGDPRISVGTFYLAGNELNQIGGDWYDAFMVSEDCLGLVVGDIVGGGIEAATAMAQVQTALHAYALERGGVALTLDKLNRYVTTVPGAVASSVVYAEIDLSTNTMAYGSAGHPPPVLISPGNSPELLWGARTALLGISDIPPEEKVISLPTGSTVLLYTDGLIERRGRTLDDGLQSLLDVIAENDEFADRPELLTQMLDSGNDDDICLIAATLVPTQVDATR